MYFGFARSSTNSLYNMIQLCNNLLIFAEEENMYNVYKEKDRDLIFTRPKTTRLWWWWK